MAETLTYDPTPADQPELSEDEQNSLEVGEKLQTQQDELLAGKFKDAQELESAYIELQKKMGSNKETDTEVENKSEEKNETESKEYLEDGSVNYEEVSNQYGEKLGQVFQDNGIDIFEMGRTFHENKGELPTEMRQKLIDSGLSEQLVDTFTDGIAAKSGYNNVPEDITDAQQRDIMGIVGGEKGYENLVNWATSNLEESQVEAFDSIVTTGNPAAIQLAVEGMKAKYEEANGYEGRMLTGKAAKSTDAFRSQAEVVQAMKDPRYEADPAYRQDVYDKLDRSQIKF